VGQHFANLAPKVGWGEGLLDERHAWDQHVGADEFAAVSGHVKNFYFRAKRADLFGQGGAVHTGHDHIRHQQIDHNFLVNNAQRFLALGRGQHIAAGGAQGPADQLAQGFRVFDHEHGFSRKHGFGVVVFSRFNDLARLDLGRKKNLEGRSPPQRALDFDVTVTLLYDSVNRGQSQTRSFTYGFGGEKRFEYVCLGLRVHAGSSVSHLQQHKSAGGRARSGLRIHLLDILCLDAKAAAVGHGVACVDDQIQNNLFDLPRVGLYVVQLRIEHEREFDVLLDKASQHLVEGADRLVDIQDHRFDHLLPAQHQELASKRGRAVAGLLDLFQAPAIGIGQIETLEQQIAIAVDHRQQVIEVVSHAAGEKTDRFHPLGLLQ